ncbi:MAG: LacI family transcriptional regulator [Clostridiales bacterium]|jgi:LacI family transcriptional regulator|nr:LacI family transcriptional regulator [Clostridiales bacterium]
MYKKISIKDIAAECNVSATTVSRALNGSKEISEETRNYILKVCEEKNYTPNLLARSLILKKTNMIGLIIPDITNQYYSYVSKGVGTYLESLGYGVILCNLDRKKANEKMYINFLIQRMVDGIIMIPIEPDRKDYEPITARNIPLLLLDNYVYDLDVSFVSNDNYAGARKIIMHMINQGYRRIGAIIGGKDSSASNDRLKGYIDVLKANGIEFDEKLIIHSKATFEDGYNKAKQLIDANVDSIFAINDTVAMGVMKYCYSNGIRIPEDVGIAGYDDIEQASMLPVPLTTVHQKKYSLGFKAAEILISEINNPNQSKQKVILQPELVKRKSCKE